MKTLRMHLTIETILSTVNIAQVGNSVHMLAVDMDRKVLTVFEGKHIILLKQYFNQLDINYEN